MKKYIPLFILPLSLITMTAFAQDPPAAPPADARAEPAKPPVEAASPSTDSPAKSTEHAPLPTISVVPSPRQATFKSFIWQVPEINGNLNPAGPNLWEYKGMELVSVVPSTARKRIPGVNPPAFTDVPIVIYTFKDPSGKN